MEDPDENEVKGGRRSCSDEHIDSGREWKGEERGRGCSGEHGNLGRLKGGSDVLEGK